MPFMNDPNDYRPWIYRFIFRYMQDPNGNSFYTLSSKQIVVWAYDSCSCIEVSIFVPDIEARKFLSKEKRSYEILILHC